MCHKTLLVTHVVMPELLRHSSILSTNPKRRRQQYNSYQTREKKDSICKQNQNHRRHLCFVYCCSISKHQFYTLSYTTCQGKKKTEDSILSCSPLHSLLNLIWRIFVLVTQHSLRSFLHFTYSFLHWAPFCAHLLHCTPFCTPFCTHLL